MAERVEVEEVEVLVGVLVCVERREALQVQP